MSTTLNIKEEVALQLGKTNGAVADTKRDTAIIRARRKFYKEIPWSFLKNVATVTFSSGVATIPTDMDTTFDVQVYSYTGELKTEYKHVDVEDVDSYTSDYPVFAIDIEGGQLKTNLDGTVDITYQKEVSDTLSDVFVEPCDISAIVNLAIALFWLSSERNDDMYKLFMESYNKELQRLVTLDRVKAPVKRFKVDYSDYGYNGE